MRACKSFVRVDYSNQNIILPMLKYTIEMPRTKFFGGLIVKNIVICSKVFPCWFIFFCDWFAKFGPQEIGFAPSSGYNQELTDFTVFLTIKQKLPTMISKYSSFQDTFCSF